MIGDELIASARHPPVDPRSASHRRAPSAPWIRDLHLTDARHPPPGSAIIASMQPRARVLAVAQSANPGGAERALTRIAERLPEHGFDVELASPGSGADHRLPVGGLAVGAWPQAIAAWPRARRLARRFDLVLLNGIVTQRLAPAMTAATIVPYIHELADSAPRAWRSQRYWHATPVVLCSSGAVARRCRALGAPADRLRTVYPPAEAIAPAPRPEWADGAVVGFVGRIEPGKGVLDLVRAMRGVDARLVVIGDAAGAYADQVRAEASDRVVFTGRVDDARSLMTWFDVVAAPSHREAFGMVAGEALAAGTPVVATLGSGIEEHIERGRNGELVMAGDVDALSDAIRRLLPRAASMAAAAKETAARFRTDVVAAEVAAALRDALAMRKAVAA
jgi:glycosyltransferase involved in cell wall biosynthesis